MRLLKVILAFLVTISVTTPVVAQSTFTRDATGILVETGPIEDICVKFGEQDNRTIRGQRVWITVPGQARRPDGVIMQTHTGPACGVRRSSVSTIQPNRHSLATQLALNNGQRRFACENNIAYLINADNTYTSDPVPECT